MEADLHVDLDRDRFAVLGGGGEMPLLDGFHSSIVNVFFEGPDDMHFLRFPL